jgi:hypothetical protein
MITILYNTDTNSVEHRIIGKYMVDGRPGKVDHPIIELQEITAVQPEHNSSVEYAVSEWVIEGTNYVQKWDVIAKTQDQIQAELAQVENSPEVKIAQMESVIAELIIKLNEKNIIP